jgi:hypothetical protein
VVTHTACRRGFPDGLTLLTGLGRFHNASGMIIQERSRLLILLYPVEDRQDKRAKIEMIRWRYKERFQQESVWRVDRWRASRILIGLAMDWPRQRPALPL